MTVVSHVVARVSVVAAAISTTLYVPAANAGDLANPAPLVEAFRTTCLAGFSSVDAIARNAIAAGWIEHKITLGSRPGKGMNAINMPRFFERRGLIMTVESAGEGVLAMSCQVSSSSADTLDTTALAAATSAALGLGQAARGKKSGSDLAQWRRAPDQLIQASAGKTDGMWEATLLVRLEADVPRKMNLLRGR